MHELVAHLAFGRNPLRPMHHKGIADAAAMGVLLVAAQRRVRRHRPAMREIGVRVRPADIVDPAQLFGDRLRPEIIRSHRVDETERAALLAGAIVRQHQNQRIVGNPGRFQEADQPRQMAVGVVEHAGECCLQSRKHPLLVGRMFVPGFDAVIAWRHLRLRRHQAHRLLPRQPLLALDVPAMGEDGVIRL